MQAKPICPACGARSIYTLKDGTRVCKVCGARTPRKGGQ